MCIRDRSGAASTTTATAGLPEIWDILVDGTSDATDSTTTVEEFFIYLTGNSGTGVFVDLGIRRAGDGQELQWGNSNVGNPASGDLNLPNVDLDTATSIATALGFTLPTANMPGTLRTTIAGLASFTDLDDTTIGTFRQNITIASNHTAFVSGSGANRVYQFRFNVTAQTNVPGLQTNISDDRLETSITSGNPSTVQVSIPTETIDETFTLTGGLTTATTLRDDLLTMIQANTGITDEFVVLGATADAMTTGVPLGEPIITLLANDNTDHAIGVTFNNGGGDLSSSAFGSHVEGSPSSVSTEIRITYDPDLTPSFQDIIFGGTADSEATATVLSNMINAHGDLSTTTVPIDVVGLTRGSVTFNYADNVADVGLREFAFTNGTSDLAGAERFRGINLPAARPEDAFLVAIFAGNTDFDEGIEEAFPGVYTPGTILRSVDVSRFRRRLLVTTENFTVSYAIDEFSADTDSRIQFFNLSGGRDLTAEEQAVINGIVIPSTRPYVVTIVSSAVNEIVRITTSSRDNFDAPTITTTTAGTSSNPPTFNITTFQEGDAPVPGVGTRSTYSVSYAGTEVIASTELPSGVGLTDAGTLIATAVNTLTTHTATGTNPFTATSVENSADDLIVTIAPGLNDDMSVPTLAVARSVTQEGSLVAVFGGADGNIEVLVGTTALLNMNVGGMTTNQIATLIFDTYSADPTFNASIVGNTINLIGANSGSANPPSVLVQVGSNADGSAGTLAAALTTINNGDPIVDTAGTPSSFTINVGALEVASGTFPGAVTSAAAATQIAGEFTNIMNYNSMVTGASVTAISTFLNTIPDITVAIDQGMSSGTNPPPTLAVSRIVVNEGAAPTIDFTNTIWDYYILNQEVRVDDDTVDMMDNNTITIPRGLVVDSEQIDMSGTAATIVATEMYSTAAHRSNLVLTGGVSEPLLITNTGTDTRQYALDWSLDGNVWTQALVTQTFNPNFGGTANGQIFNNVQFIGAQINDVPASSTVHFRARRLGGVAAIGGWGFGFLIIEERNVEMTT